MYLQYYKRAVRRNAAVMCLCYAERSGAAKNGWGLVDSGSRLIDFLLSSAALCNHDNTRLLAVLGMMSAAKGKGQGPETLITVHFRPLIYCEALKPKRNHRKKDTFF